MTNVKKNDDGALTQFSIVKKDAYRTARRIKGQSFRFLAGDNLQEFQDFANVIQDLVPQVITPEVDQKALKQLAVNNIRT